MQLKNLQTHFLPGYPKAIFLQPEDRNYRGLFDDNTVGEITSDEVDGCSLSEVLGRLDAFAVAHEQLKATRKLAEKSAADARRAEEYRKFHEKVNRQRLWEEKEKASAVYRPRPRTVPVVQCSTPTPPPESPKKASVSRDDTAPKSSSPASDSLSPRQKPADETTRSTKSASAGSSTG